MGRATRTRTIRDLRRAIDCLPAATRTAMLEGVRDEQIIVGAYADRHGGICPMLAAHRRGGRTSFVSFARAWDRFTDAKRARRATRREVRVLAANLAASLQADGGVDMREAIAHHRAMVADPAGTLARLEASSATLQPGRAEPARASQSVSPGRLKMISGIRQPGESVSR